MSVKRDGARGYGGFIVIVLAVMLCFSVSSVPTPLYPLYVDTWQIPHSAVSGIFAIYMMAVLFTLLCLGRVSDTFGRINVILVALLIVLVGLLLAGLATGLSMLLASRLVTGLGNGLLTTAATLALIDAHPVHDKRLASAAASTAITVGFGVGPLMSGAVAQLGVRPLALPYVLPFVLIAVLAAVIWRLRRQLQPADFVSRPLSIRPALSLPGPVTRKVFLMACLAGFINYAAGSAYFTHMPSLMREALPWQGPLITGAVFIPMAVVSLLVQTAHRSAQPFKGLAWGLVCLAGTAVCSVLSAQPWATIHIVFLGMVLLGAGQGYAFMSGVTIANLNANPQQRAANMSTFFLSAYLGAGLPVMLVGYLADRIGLLTAITGFNVVLVIGLLALATWAWRLRAAPGGPTET